MAHEIVRRIEHSLSVLKNVSNLQDLSKENDLIRSLYSSIFQFRKFQNLRISANEQDNNTLVLQYLEQASSLDEKLQSLQKDSRSLTLAAKSRIDQITKTEREQLLQGGKEEMMKLRQRATESSKSNESELKTSMKVTESLRTAVQMMHNEIERSEQSVHALDDQTRLMSKTGDQYQTFGSVLDGSSKLGLERSVVDIALSFCFFDDCFEHHEEKNLDSWWFYDIWDFKK
ncbi:hypothetical protein HK096_002961 [Nowakowskiella sp. JEL0078]|nr:hypothetical protein HK096_002961 [Nowakowskiella sp. JEL0078]